jgi:hypothetical protein
MLWPGFKPKTSRIQVALALHIPSGPVQEVITLNSGQISVFFSLRFSMAFSVSRHMSGYCLEVDHDISISIKIFPYYFHLILLYTIN